MKPTSDASYGTSKVKPEALVQCVCIASNYGHVIGMICYVEQLIIREYTMRLFWFHWSVVSSVQYN